VPTLTLAPRAEARGWMPVRRETVRRVTVLRALGTRLPKARFSGRALNYLSYFASATAAPVRAHRPDVVMSLTDPPILGLAALAWARRWRVPFVFLCQDVFPEAASLLEDFKSAPINRALERNRLLVPGDGDRRHRETMARRLVEDWGADPSRSVSSTTADRVVIRPAPKRNAFEARPGRPLLRRRLGEPRPRPGLRRCSGRGSPRPPRPVVVLQGRRRPREAARRNARARPG
jgi:hypothetical protein